MTNGLTTSNLIAGATELLERGGYRRASDEKTGTWSSGIARIFEDPYGIVAVVVYETATQLVTEWTNAQSELVSTISRYVDRTDAKASEGYLVLLTPAELPLGDRETAMRIRYDTGRVRKLVATGDDIRSLRDIESVISPLLPLEVGPPASPTDSSLDTLPTLLADGDLSESSIKLVVEAYGKSELLVETLYKRLP
jgi:hypothetical protein